MEYIVKTNTTFEVRTVCLGDGEPVFAGYGSIEPSYLLIASMETDGMYRYRLVVYDYDNTDDVIDRYVYDSRISIGMIERLQKHPYYHAAMRMIYIHLTNNVIYPIYKYRCKKQYYLIKHYTKLSIETILTRYIVTGKRR